MSCKTNLTSRALLELAQHEGIVLEAYKDSRGIWTWGVGVTNSSGHKVCPRYKDNPSTVERTLEVFKWLVETKYMPDVVETLGDDLEEHELAAAVSFHYNTGSIRSAQWVKSYLAGNIEAARKEFMNWRSPKEIIPRREAERDLFFDGKWSDRLNATVYERVSKPSYSPDWSSAKSVDISNMLKDG